MAGRRGGRAEVRRWASAPSIAATHGFFFCRAAMRSMPFCPMPATSSAAAPLSSASSILMFAPAIHEPGLAEISTAPLIASSSSTRVMTCAHGARRAGCKGARVTPGSARKPRGCARTSSNSWMSSIESVFCTSPGQSSRSTATPCWLTSTLSAVDFVRLPRRAPSVPTRLSMAQVFGARFWELVMSLVGPAKARQDSATGGDIW